MYFSLRENMMCGVRGLSGSNKSNEGGRVFAKGQLGLYADSKIGF